MALVSLEQDATYRREGTNYVEVCRVCGLDRADDTACACGATFERKQGSIIDIVPTSIRPTLPNVCPHCGAPPTHVRGVATVVPGGIRVTLEMQTCRRVLPPFAAYMLLVISMFCLAVGALAAVFGNLGAIAFAALALAGVLASWRAYSWLRIVRVDHRSMTFRVRRADYAVALADLNGGRVVGSLRSHGSATGGGIPQAKVVTSR